MLAYDFVTLSFAISGINYLNGKRMEVEIEIESRKSIGFFCASDNKKSFFFRRQLSWPMGEVLLFLQARCDRKSCAHQYFFITQSKSLCFVLFSWIYV